MHQHPQAGSAVPKRRASRQKAMDRQNNLLLYGTLLCVLGFVLLENTGISISIPSILWRVLTVGGFGTAFLFMNRRDVAKSLRRSPCVYAMMALAGFAVMMAISGFVNRKTIAGSNTVTSALMYLLCLFEMLCVVLYGTATGKTSEIFEFVFRVLLGFVLANDALMLSGMIHFSDGLFETYLVGTKFDVVYMHMNLMTLFLTRMKLLRRGNKSARLPVPMLVTFLALNVVISVRVDCNTGMLGSLLIIAIIYVFDRKQEQLRTILCSVRVFLIVCVISMMFAYYIFWVIEQPIVQYIIVEQLGRSLTLTGRTEIYELFPSVMSGHWIWGYGILNAYRICMQYMGYSDVQNAILQWVMECGVPSTAMMIAFFCTILSVCRRKKSIAVIMPIAALVYVYLLLGTVEITINRCFFLMMLLMLLLAAGDQLPNKRLGITGTEEKQE